MSILTQYGLQLIAGKPDAEGLCTYKLMCGNEEFATIDRACTLDEALAAAEQFLEKMREEE